MGMIQDFKDFAFKGNLIDMAVGIVMGGAVAAIVGSFLKNIISPLIAGILQVPDLSSLKYPIGAPIAKTVDGKEIVEQATLNYGTFIQNTLDFVILAFVIFIALKVASSMMKKAEEEAPVPADIELLTEIRDALRK